MALGFGRKKAVGDASATPLETSAPDVQAAPVAPHAPSSPPNDTADVFDLDAFALPTNDADSGVAASTATIDATSGSAFDFPETEAPGAQLTGTTTPANSENAPLDFDALYEVEQANAARNAAQNVAATSAPAPFVPPTATIQEPAVPFYEPQEKVEPIIHVAPSKPKRKLPLLPILGALAILGLGGSAAYLMGQGEPESEETPIAVPPRRETRPEPPAAPAAATQVVRVKPVPVAVDPLPGTANAVRPGIAPAPDKRTQLKALWRRGADAKHRRDYDGARRYWNQGLKIQPNNTGFKESIAKLPR